MKVFKFGGASISSVEKVDNIRSILQSYQNGKILVVISAIGKTTNALEKVTEAFYKGKLDEALGLFEAIKNNHLTIAKYLLVTGYNTVHKKMLDIFTEVEWLIYDKPVRNFDYYYDQIVCAGELMSTCIISAYLTESGLVNTWIDVRDVIRTDNNFRDAVINWPATQLNVESIVLPAFETVNLVIVQGFIGSTYDNESTTLGREGSDYTAAVFANMLDASGLTIWKDVEGVMNADPKIFPDAVFLQELNYDEVVEMAYYGAQVIHPKTIKPLQNKNIPLYVKCFLDKELPGTLIHDKPVNDLPPIIVIKENQVLVHLHTRDFSFAGGQPIAELYQLLDQIRIKPNLLQTGAVSIDICLDDHPEKIEKLSLAASANFDVQVEKSLSLLTIRHYREETVQRLTSGKKIRLKQQSSFTVQMVISDI